MIRMEEVLEILEEMRVGTGNKSSRSDKRIELLDEVERKIRSLETRRRLIVIDGGAK
jgi:hypothetical protein